MSVYKPTMRHLREVLLYYFNRSESANQAYQMLIYAYSKDIISIATCNRNFRRFSSGDFNLKRPTFKRLNKEGAIEDLVRLRLENPRITQTEMGAKVGISQYSVSRYLNSQEYQNKLKEKEQEQSSIPLEFTTPSQVRRKRTVEELVRLRLEDPSITQAEMATKVGKSQNTVSKYLRSQEYQNTLKEKKQEQSSLPLDLTVKRRRTDSDRD